MRFRRWTSTGREMKYREFTPHEALRDDVRCLWILEQDHPEGSIQAVTPDGCVELILNFGSPYRPMAGRAKAPLPTAFIVGFQDWTIRFRVSGTVKVVAARLNAWAALTLLDDAGGASAHSVRGLGRAWDRPERREIVAQIGADVKRGDYEHGAMRLQGLLIERALVRGFDRQKVQSAAQLLHRAKGQVRIEDLAGYCDLSVRQLQRRFQKVVGTTPKVFARTLRFEAAQRTLMFDPDADLTRLAHECGYFDQAHFIKDFKEFAGRTPREYARDMVRLQRTLKAKDVVFLQSRASPPG